MAFRVVNFPQQQIPESKKNDEWRRQCVDWADSRSCLNSSPVRKSVMHKQINIDLLHGKLHMDDLQRILDPDKSKIKGDVPDDIQHYPIMCSKINLLLGEEKNRTFDYRVVVTNPNAISKIEESRKKAILERYEKFLNQPETDDIQQQQELMRINEYFSYSWQDMREIRANALLNHYAKEQNFRITFDQGFETGCAIGEEAYQCTIVNGEPKLIYLDPQKLTIYQSGYSSRIEDADIIIYEDYWSPGAIYDAYGDALTQKDRDYIEKLSTDSGSYSDEMDNIDPRLEFVPASFVGEDGVMVTGDDMPIISQGATSPFDMFGNIRVMKVFWKSRRKVVKVKGYDPITGEEVFNVFPEGHKIDKTLGEEATEFWINEAWEGTKIGSDVYVNIRPCPIQYSRLSNPSECHFGIIGTIYSRINGKPFSLVDMMKPYNYLYDVIHDRLNKCIARNWGKLIKLDLAKVPDKWPIEKWMHFAKINGIIIEDSFKEGNKGVATGKLAGALNNNTNGVVDAQSSEMITQYMTLLQYISNEMSQIVGITQQREGQISSRETVGGVERATVQSAHITQWIFSMHDDVKRRVLECFIETAKIAMRGQSKKFQYLMSDNSFNLVDIEGDEFSECDYGLVVDSSDSMQKLAQQLDTLAQAALQTQTLDFSTIMKLYNSTSLAEKQRMVERAEGEMRKRREQEQQQEREAQEQQTAMQLDLARINMEFQERMKKMDNETKIRIAEIEAHSKYVTMKQDDPEQFQKELAEKAREHDEKMAMEQQKLDREQEQHDEDNAMKAALQEMVEANKAMMNYENIKQKIKESKDAEV